MKIKSTEMKTVLSFLGRLAAMAGLLWLMFGVIFGITPMANHDMMPGIGAGDLMLYYRLERDLYAQDVIVFKKAKEQYVGRVIARGGDRVEITEEAKLMINGNVVLENNIYFSTPQYDGKVEYPLMLKEDQFFVLCDYREGAKDSRYFGAVERDEIKGKVITVVRRSSL